MSVLLLANEYVNHRDRKPSIVIALTDQFNGLAMEPFINAATMLQRTINKGGPAGQYLMRHLKAHDNADKLEEYCQRLVTVLHWTLVEQSLQLRCSSPGGDYQDQRPYTDYIGPILQIITGKSNTLANPKAIMDWLEKFGNLDMHKSISRFRTRWMQFRRTVSTSPSEGVIGSTQTVAQTILINAMIEWAPYGDTGEFHNYLLERKDLKYTAAYPGEAIRSLLSWMTTTTAVDFSAGIIAYWMYRQNLILPF